MQDLILLLRLKILEKDAETLLDGLQKLIDEVQKFGGGRARLLVEQKLKNRAFKLMNSIKGLRNKLPNLAALKPLLPLRGSSKHSRLEDIRSLMA